MIVLFGGCGGTSTAERPGTVVRDNLAVLMTLVGEIGTDLNRRFGAGLPDTVVLEIDSSAAAWVVRSNLTSILSRDGRHILTRGESGPGRARWVVHGIRLGVSYSNIRKPGIFSEPLVDREVRAEFTSEISRSTGVLGAETGSRVFRDTVRENDVASLESREMDFTRGRVPDLDSWDRFIEPFVIIGAAGTAIFLFFQVRS